ncbi:hypothetical protein StoSoilB19_25510 [Arthrobacter sp. StoSoilB19]|nr:hypothetical protein StoSoilB19_25510 [Arthrobacter sp. StoSoilB19]
MAFFQFLYFEPQNSYFFGQDTDFVLSLGLLERQMKADQDEQKQCHREKKV